MVSLTVARLPAPIRSQASREAWRAFFQSSVDLPRRSAQPALQLGLDLVPRLVGVERAGLPAVLVGRGGSAS